MPRPAELEIDVHTSVGIVRPGDKLVVAVSRRLTDKEAHDTKAILEDRLQGVEVVLVEADALVVYRT